MNIKRKKDALIEPGTNGKGTFREEGTTKNATSNFHWIEEKSRITPNSIYLKMFSGFL